MYRTKKEILYDMEDILDYKFLKRNTYRIWYKDGNEVIRYHLTDIITHNNNGDIVLNTNGYKTESTRERLNEFCEFYSYNKWIIQKDYEWYVTPYISNHVQSFNPKAPNFMGIKFYDGITFDSKGNLKE